MAEHLQRQGRRLRRARKALKLSQEEAAHLIGVSSKTFGSWERGEAEPRDSNWRKIEEQLKVRADEVRGEPPVDQLTRLEGKVDRLLELLEDQPPGPNAGEPIVPPLGDGRQSTTPEAPDEPESPAAASG
jgi:transcriptional regulator with XRE-family HTH domain